MSGAKKTHFKATFFLFKILFISSMAAAAASLPAPVTLKELEKRKCISLSRKATYTHRYNLQKRLRITTQLKHVYKRYNTTTRSFPHPSHTPLATEHIILVHGESHGAWSWFKLMPLLTTHGYNVTAIDLAGNGINPEQTSSFRSATEYFKPLIDLMESLPSTEKVVLVGHAFGGIAISQAMERFPDKIQCAVFVTAYMPGPGLNISTIRDEAGRREGDQLDNIAIYGNGRDNTPTASNLGPKFLKSKFYPLSPIEDWVLATTLMRPTPFFTENDLSSQELIYTNERYGSVKRAYIIVKDDVIIDKDLQMWMIEKNAPNLIEEISEADHMVMNSKPSELSNALIKIIENVKDM